MQQIFYTFIKSLSVLFLMLFFFSGCDNSSTYIPMEEPDIHANRPSIPWKKETTYHEGSVFDLDKNGVPSYQSFPIERGTHDPLFYALNKLSMGTLRNYVANCRISRIQLENGEHQVFLLGEPEFTDKKREREFMNFLRYTTEIYTPKYRFFMNENEFKVN